jgi:zinc/manganese transport system ATP-binding protein
VLTSRTLSELYRTPVDVLDVRGRIVVVGTQEEPGGCEHHEQHGDTSAGATRELPAGSVRRG